MSHPSLVELDKRKSRLAGLDVSREEINLALRPRWTRHCRARERVSDWGPPLSEPALGRLLDTVLGSGGAVSRRGAAGLLELWRAIEPDAPADFRQGPGRPLCQKHRPAPPQVIDKALQRFFDWIFAPSFAQLHPIVQMSLAQARLMELQPFAEPCEAVVSAFAAGFPVQAGFLLPVPDPQSADRFPPALQQAFQLSTAGLVKFNLEAALHSYSLADGLLGL